MPVLPSECCQAVAPLLHDDRYQTSPWRCSPIPWLSACYHLPCAHRLPPGYKRQWRHHSPLVKPAGYRDCCRQRLPRLNVRLNVQTQRIFPVAVSPQPCDWKACTRYRGWQRPGWPVVRYPHPPDPGACRTFPPPVGSGWLVRPPLTFRRPLPRGAALGSSGSHDVSDHLRCDARRDELARHPWGRVDPTGWRS